MGITTAEQLLRAGDIGRCELLAGELRRMIPPGFEHGRITMNLAVAIANHVDSHRLGTVVAAETGFVLARDPDTVRAPDIAFLYASRPSGPQHGYYPGAPDLAVEVLSPDDRPGYVQEKVAEWLEAGTLAVWVIDPRERTVTNRSAGEHTVILEDSGVLTVCELLPGFALAVRDIFA